MKNCDWLILLCFMCYALCKSLCFDPKAVKTRWAEFKEIIYKPGLCIVLNISSNYLLQFGIVKHVLCNDSNNLCLVCQNLLNTGFCENLYGYEVEILSSEMSCIVVEKLYHFFPAIIAHLPKSGLLVSTKHAV